MSERTNIERSVAGLATLIIFPVIFAIFGAYTPDLRKDYGDDVFWGWFVLAVVFGLFAWRFNPSERAEISLVLENEEFAEQIDDLEANLNELHRAINLLSLQSGYSMSMRAVLIQHSRAGIADMSGLKRVIEEITSPLYLEGEEIFGFGASESWNFAVYLYSEKRNILLPVWREKARNHPSQGLGRVWGMGQGHVGKAFVDKRALITGDASGGEAREFAEAPHDLRRGYDLSAYVSFASVPIGPILAGDKRPYGVIVGTSDRPERFDIERAGILMHVASAIASVLISAGLDIDKLMTDDEAAQLIKGERYEA